MQVFKPSKRTGFHWKNLQKTIRTIKRVPLDIRGDRERKFEDRIAGALTLPFKEFFIDQRNTKQVMTRVSLFDHDHRPDMSIDTDGVAVEVKVIKSGQSFREAIGQALIYRLGYRFVLIIWIDTTKNKTYYDLITSRKSPEYKFLKKLEENNIFFRDQMKLNILQSN